MFGLIVHHFRHRYVPTKQLIIWLATYKSEIDPSN